MDRQKGLDRVPYFNNVDDVREAQSRKANYQPADLYPRDGYLSLTRLESRVSELVGVEPENLLLYSSGMATIVDVLEIDHPSSGTVIVQGEQLYNQSCSYVRDSLGPRGVREIPVDSGSIDSITRAVIKHRPQIIFLETVANGPDVPVLDIAGLFNVLDNEEQKPLVILDNTLPSPTGLPLHEVLRGHPNTIAVESGTKFYSLNAELCGIAYTYDQELLRRLRAMRRFGSILSPSAAETINEVLPSREEFHARNRRILTNTLTLALACSEVESSDFIISYHPNGASPVLFIQIADHRLDQFKVADKLWEDSVVRQYCKLGQSFGFDQTRLWPDPNYPALRISGGTENEAEIQQLAEAFRESLFKITRKEK